MIYIDTTNRICTHKSTEEERVDTDPTNSQSNRTLPMIYIETTNRI